jgi:NAD-dependent SIR2 family protein deacetylase
MEGYAGTRLEIGACPRVLARKCGKAFERQEHVAEHEKSHPRCPKCQSPDVQPVLTDFYAKTSKKS